MRITTLVMLALCSCSAKVVQVMPDRLATGATSAPADPTFEIVARVAGVHDPLPVSGAEVAYSDLEHTFAQAIVRAVAPRHDSVLTVELIGGDASYDSARVAVTLLARATLRSRVGNQFIAQTQVACRDGAIVPPQEGGRVVWSCMTRLGKDLSGWLEGLPPAEPTEEP